MRLCEHAEVVLSAGMPADPRTTVAALVTHHGAAYGGPSSLGPRSTSGVVVKDDFVIERSVAHFHTHLCWYLDNTFCGQLHAAYARGEANLDELLQGILFAIWACAIAVFAWELFRAMQLTMKHAAKAHLSFRTGALEYLVRSCDRIQRHWATLFLLVPPRRQPSAPHSDVPLMPPRARDRSPARRCGGKPLVRASTATTSRRWSRTRSATSWALGIRTSSLWTT